MSHCHSFSQPHCHLACWPVPRRTRRCHRQLCLRRAEDHWLGSSKATRRPPEEVDSSMSRAVFHQCRHSWTAREWCTMSSRWALRWLRREQKKPCVDQCCRSKQKKNLKTSWEHNATNAARLLEQATD